MVSISPKGRARPFLDLLRYDDIPAAVDSMLATMVCEHMRRSFSEPDRNALRTNVEYAQRSRDPAV